MGRPVYSLARMTRPIQVALFSLLAFQHSFCQLAPFSIKNNQNVMDKSAFFDLKAPLSIPTPSPFPNMGLDTETRRDVLAFLQKLLQNPKLDKSMEQMKAMLAVIQKVQNPDMGLEDIDEEMKVLSPFIMGLDASYWALDKTTTIAPNPAKIGIEDLPNVNKILQAQNDWRPPQPRWCSDPFQAETWSKLTPWCNGRRTWNYCIQQKPCKVTSDCKRGYMCSPTYEYEWSGWFKPKTCVYGDRRKRSADDHPNEMMDAHHKNDRHYWPKDPLPSYLLWDFCIKYKPCNFNSQCPPMQGMNGKCRRSRWTNPGTDDFMICD